MASYNRIFFLIFAFIVSVSVQASTQASIQTSTQAETKQRHPFYVGVAGGSGATTWSYLVPKYMSDALSTSIPVRVSEGGKVWGVQVGYEFIPEFAMELSYMYYPVANLYFDEDSLFTYLQHGNNKLKTHTSRVALAGKIMLTIPHTPVKAFSSFGAAEVYRYDKIVRRWRLNPTFGAGLDYDITEHVMAEVGTEYVAGYGQSELDPCDHFIPFLYSGFFRLNYRF
jgi:opacity protein-like surface antigen